MATPLPSPAAGPGRAEPHRSVLAALIVFHAFYYSFRYPLQVNSSTTSAIYADTPMVLRVADDAAFLLLLAVVVLMKLGRRRLFLNRRHILLAGAMLLCFSGILLGFGLRSGLKVKGIVIYSALLAVTSAADLRFMLSFIFRHLPVFYLILLLVDGLQILLFLSIGRPPALSWSTNPHSILTQDTRFGSLWDDPNSFGLFLVFIVTWVLHGEMGWKRKLLLLAPVPIAAAASWSRTCFLLLGVSVAGYLIAEAWRAFDRQRFLHATIRAALVAASATGALLLLPSALTWASDRVTSRIHLHAVLMRDVDSVPLRLAYGPMGHSESVFTFVAQSGGWFTAVALMLLLAVPLLHLLRFQRLPARDRTLVAWAGLSLVSFFSIPFLWLAPMGLLYFLTLGYLVDRFGTSPRETVDARP
jgi:hypothetical protein